MGGWSWNGDDGSPSSRQDSESSVRLARRLLNLIEETVREPARFELTPALICEFNGIVVVADPGTTSGVFRGRDVEIAGSKHDPPTWHDVPRFVEEMCAHVNRGGRDAIETAAYVTWRLNWVHPFDEGNGRTARATAYLVLCVLLGQALPGEVTFIERLMWNKRRYYHALEEADEAWKTGRLDVSAMTRLLRELLEAQLAGGSAT